MGNKQSPRLFIQTDCTAYLPGDEVTGSVYAHLPTSLASETLWLQIIGFEFCSRISSIGGQNRNPGRHDYFNYKVPLSHWPTKLVEAGDYSFPFVFVLPSGLPGSLALRQQGIIAEISYKILASFQGLDVSDEISLLVAQPSAEALKPDFQTVTRPIRYISCFNRGVVSMSARFIDRQIELGSFAKIMIEVDNKQSASSITHITCSLWRKLSITSNTGERFEVRDLVSSSRIAGLPSRGNLVSTQEVELRISPADVVSRHLSSAEGQMITCSYYLEVSAAFESWLCMNTPSISLMSTVNLHSKTPQTRVTPELPEVWSPQIMPVANLGNSTRSLLSLSFNDI
jgi:hypothetical protein